MLWSPGGSAAQPPGPPGQRGALPAESPPERRVGRDVGPCSRAGHGREGAAPHTSPRCASHQLDQGEGHVPVRRPEGRDGQRGGHSGALRAGESLRLGPSHLLSESALILSVREPSRRTMALTGSLPSPRNAETCCPSLRPLPTALVPVILGVPSSSALTLQLPPAKTWELCVLFPGKGLEEGRQGSWGVGHVPGDSSCPHLNSVTCHQQE